MGFALPRTLTLPSGQRVTLRARTASAEPSRRGEDAPLFSEVLALFDDGIVELTRERAPVDVRDLPLADFHVVRAFLTKAGLVHEEEVELDCHNCGELLTSHPCRGLETGPWEDGELDDPELDRTEPFGAPLPIRTVELGRVREAKDVTLAARTVRDVLPLWTALAHDPVVIDEDLVTALGVVQLGPLRDASRIAKAFADADVLSAVGETFLAAHYPLRLGADVFCTKCKARNTVDAPAEREIATDETSEEEEATEEDLPPLPPLEEFVELAHRIAEPLIAEIPGERVQLIVEDGTPAVDDGGEPLLGSYVPPPAPGSLAPVQPPTVTIYFQTFARIEREEGRYDWEDELRETIEHELEHHVYHLRGDDPMDAAEHEEIDREVARIVGRGESTRRTLAVFGHSIPDFVRRTWPLFVVAAAALALSLAQGRCGE